MPQTGAATPAPVAQDDQDKVASDPVSGQSQDVDFSWEQLCVSSDYQVQIAKDPNFAIVVVDTGHFVPGSPTSPSAYYPAAGRSTMSPSALSPLAGLESGHTYYWRVRVVRAATGEYVHSPWSETKSFTVEAGLPTTSVSGGPQSVYPNNCRIGCPVTGAAFTWSPVYDATKYRFVLAKDAAMTQVIKEVDVPTTAYQYDGTLEYSTNYFWRVMAIEPVPSDWSATFSFQTEAAPPQPIPVAATAPGTPTWAWAIIAIGAALVIVTIVFIFRFRSK